MRIALTGATGLVGQFIARRLIADGHDLLTLGRAPSRHGGTHRPWRLGEPAPIGNCDALVHCAFAHVPGRYRGGEGDDPAGFLRTNLDGTLRLWDDAQGLRLIFLSSRAVYDGQPPGTLLTEDLALAPDSLYGQAKLAAEPPLGASLRATGVYGPPAPDQRHKWADLFDAFARGEAVAPALGSEVHGEDLAQAVALLLATDATGAFNASDILLDRRDLLTLWSEVSGVRGSLPTYATTAPNVMDTERLEALGWRPGGMPALRETLATMAA